jgi:hypothetical protein
MPRFRRRRQPIEFLIVCALEQKSLTTDWNIEAVPKFYRGETMHPSTAEDKW